MKDYKFWGCEHADVSPAEKNYSFIKDPRKLYDILTSEQFGGEILDYEDSTEQFREDHFAKKEKKERYEYLKLMLVKPFRHKTLEERAAEYGGKLEVNGEFDWGEPVGREIL